MRLNDAEEEDGCIYVFTREEEGGVKVGEVEEGGVEAGEVEEGEGEGEGGVEAGEVGIIEVKEVEFYLWL